MFLRYNSRPFPVFSFTENVCIKSRFYKEDLLELEFLTRILGAGTEGKIEIKSLGITSEGLRVINILGLFAKEVKVLSPDKNEYTIIVPEPAVYVIQKILTNPTRKPPEKKQKDIAAVKELLYHIEKSPEHLMKLHASFVFQWSFREPQ